MQQLSFLLLGPGTGDYSGDDSSRETGHQKNVKGQHNPAERGTLKRIFNCVKIFLFGPKLNV